MKKILFFAVLALLFSFSWAAQYDFNPTNSPGQFGYSSNTYSELGWTDLIVSQTDEIVGIQIAYTWITDSYADEGDFYIKSPAGTEVAIGSGQSSGTYNVTLNNFNGIAMNGTWQLYITDSYGDGGHQATNITVSFMYLQAGAPIAASNPSPAHNAIDVAVNGNLTWDFGADTETYELWFGPAGNMTMVDSGTAGATGSYAYSNLESIETYTWRVISRNSTRLETQGPLWSFTTVVVPVSTFPWIEDFGTTAADWPVSGWTQLYGAYPTPTESTAQWTRDDWLNGATGNNAARINIYSTSRYGWLVSHPVNIPADGYELKFDLGLTEYGTTSAVTSGAQPDDRFIVAMSDSPDMSNPTLLREWNNTGSAYVFDDISHTGSTIILSLTGITGIKYFAFYGESTVANGDNDLFVDNVTVREAPDSAIFTISPDLATYSFGNIPVGAYAEQVFTISNTGGADLTLGSIGIDPSGTDFSIPDYASIDWVLAPTENTQFTIRFEPQTAGAQSADLDIAFTREDYSIALSGTGYNPASLPFTEDWERGQSIWSIVNGTQTNGWNIGPADPYADANSAYISNDAGVTNAYTITATSISHLFIDIAFDANMMEFPLSFMWKCAGEGTAWDQMRVYLVDPSVTPIAGTALTTGLIGLANYNLQNTWIQENITLPGTLSGSLKRLVFSWTNDNSTGTQPPINIDNISLTAVPIPTGPVVAPNLDYPADDAVGLSTAGFPYEFSWNTAGTEPDVYNLYICAVSDLTASYDTVEFFNTATMFGNVSSPYTPTFTYDYEETYVWTVGGYNATYPTEVYTWPPYEFTTEDDPTIIVSPTNPWLEGFESTTFPPQSWSMLDADADGENWFLYGVENTAHTGLYSAASASWTSTAGALTPDNWLITPPIAIPATGDYMVEYYVAAQDPSYPQDHYGFYVSTTGTDPADFTLLSEETIMDGDWHYRTEALSTYAGETVYFAFRHFNCSDWFYMKIDDVAVREVPELPIFSCTPTEWDFGTVHNMNPTTPKNFVISNVGAESITINAGDIQLTNDIEGDFVLVAENLPVTLSGETTYTFTVQFIPQTIGTKTATITIDDNITREVHSIDITGVSIDEPIASIIVLDVAPEGADAARLNWASVYGDPSQEGFVHWDDSLLRGNVGAGATPFYAATKFGTEITANAAGKLLDGVMIHIAEEPQLIDTVKVWIGTDSAVAPVSEALAQAVSGLNEGWNYIALNTPVPITASDAIYVGYRSMGMADVFPASTDGLTAVGGRGNILELGGTWATLTDYSIAGNWLIHAHFADPLQPMAARRPVVLQKIPVYNVEFDKDSYRSKPIQARSVANMDRALRGFNIYRDALQINSAIVTAYTYLDEGLAAGTYNYAVQSVHYSDNGPISNTVPVTIGPPPDPISLPFTEDWASGDFETNLWTTGGANWTIDTISGNPANSAIFTWDPVVTDYSIALTSWNIDATGITNVQFSFDLYLNNFSTDAENIMYWEIWDGTQWNFLGGYSSLNDDLPWTRYAYDISTYAADRLFRIRFVAEGEDSYEINNWNIDNIHVAALPASLDPVTDLSVSNDGTNVTLSWTAVTDATWYYIYGNDDPFIAFIPIGWVESNGITLPVSTLESLGFTDKAFVKVTAGAGPFPSFEEKLSAKTAK